MRRLIRRFPSIKSIKKIVTLMVAVEVLAGIGSMAEAHGMDSAISKTEYLYEQIVKIFNKH